jgi:hypothetical protein
MNSTTPPSSNEPIHDLDPALWTDSKAAEQAGRAGHASPRRRLIDPTTCDRQYSAAELEFMTAMQNYKQQSGRMFPTWSEVLEVLRGLGYEKLLH